MRMSPISNQQSSSWFKRKRNIIKELCEHHNWLLKPLIPPRPKGYEKNMEKSYANSNIILITEQKFLRTLIKSLAI